MVSTTSIKTYHDIQIEGLVGKQQIQIYNILAKVNKPITRRELAHHTGMEIGANAGRVNEIVAKGIIVECEKRKCRLSKRMYGTIKLKEEE